MLKNLWRRRPYRSHGPGSRHGLGVSLPALLLSYLGAEGGESGQRERILMHMQRIRFLSGFLECVEGGREGCCVPGLGFGVGLWFGFKAWRCHDHFECHSDPLSSGVLLAKQLKHFTKRGLKCPNHQSQATDKGEKRPMNSRRATVQIQPLRFRFAGCTWASRADRFLCRPPSQSPLLCSPKLTKQM